MAPPTIVGALVGQSYGTSWPDLDPPKGTSWVPVQRDDERPGMFDGDIDAAMAVAVAAGTCIVARGAVDDDRYPFDYFAAIPEAML